MRKAPGESPEAAAFRDRHFWSVAAEVHAAAGNADAARAAWEKVALGFAPRATRTFTVRQKALHALALARLGRREEALALREEFRAAGFAYPPLEEALQEQP